MKIEVNGQEFESIEDYEENYVVQSMDLDGMKKDSWNLTEDNYQGEVKGIDSENLVNDDQLKWVIWGSIKAALLIYAVIATGLILFIAFCVFVWFR